MSTPTRVAAAERDTETVTLFIEESAEGLDRIEPLLLAAERGEGCGTKTLDTMFRDLHTMKGTSGFLGYVNVRVLSHAAEDLMSRLRDGGIQPASAHFACLLEVVDALRGMVDAVRETGEDGGRGRDDLVARLGALVDGGAPAEAAAPVEAPAAAVVTAPVATVATVAPVEARAASPAQPAPRPAAREEAERDSAEPSARGEGDGGTVRVPVELLDKLVNLTGELVLARNQVVQVLRHVPDSVVGAHATGQRLHLVTSELQEQIMKTRMQPVARLFERIPRLVRDLGRATGKQVACTVMGTTTEIDKALVEALRDPLLHIVRNAIDHGIERPEVRAAAGKPATGQITVRAMHEGGVVLIEISDDGAGMDPQRLRAHAVRKGLLSPAAAAELSDREALELVFRPGFSTAQAVTDLSGRGVGMDVVRTHVERACGRVELESAPGKGTTLRLAMPLTLAIISALLVRAGGQRFAIPQINLLELVLLHDEEARRAIEHVRGALVYRLRGELLPLVRLSEVLRLPPEPRPSRGTSVSIIVVAISGRRYGLIVDRVDDTEEIVIKPLDRQLKRLSCYAGATVLGDGGVALILEATGLAVLAGIDVTGRGAGEDVPRVEGAASDGGESHVLFTAGAGQRCSLPLSRVARLEQIDPQTIESLGGQEVVQYRGAIVPVVRPEATLPLGARPDGAAEQRLIVLNLPRPVALAVNEILDVADLLPDAVDRRGRAPGTLGHAVVGGRSTLVLDVLALAAPHSGSEASA